MTERLDDNPSRKERRALRRSQARSERYSPSSVKRNLLLLGGALSLSILIAVGICSNQSGDLSNSPQFVNNVDEILAISSEATYRFARSPDTVQVNEGELDKEYLQGLINSLRKERGDKTSRIQAIARNFSIVGYDINGISEGFASALMLDESGYYLTAAHVVLDGPQAINPSRIYVQTPGISSEGYLVKGLVANWNEDLALIFAPTGKERKPVESIHLVEDLLPMIDIRLMGIAGINEETSFLTILKGRYNPALAYQKSRPDLLPIENMIPYSGSSGGPAFDNEGRVVAVESGPLWSGSEPRDRKDYKGAALASISKLKALFD